MLPDALSDGAAISPLAVTITISIALLSIVVTDGATIGTSELESEVQ